jgi:mono/diheme cytochrome c family protein
MTVPSLRLGDLTDDYCPRCKLLLNHAVASLVEGKIVKVVCQTCHSEHPYRNATVPPKKRSGPRAVLFEQVLSGTGPANPEEAPEEKPEPPAPAPKKKRAVAPARYITRHSTRPPRRTR